MTTLNDKIINLLRNELYIDSSGGWVYYGDAEEAAKEIEKLILQEKIDSLNKVMGNNTWDDDQSATFKIEISELTTELNKLK